MKLNEYKQRRERLLGQMSNASVAILKGAMLQYRNRDTEYPFRQSSDFYYLTEFTEPEALLVLVKDEKGQCEDLLFCREFTVEEMQWIGPKKGFAEIQTTFDFKHVYSVKESAAMLPKILQDKKAVYYSFGDACFDKQVIAWCTLSGHQRRDLQPPVCFIDLKSIIHEMRLIKSTQEIDIMRKAAHISSAAHSILMQHCSPGMLESALEGKFINACYQAGCRAMAYGSIVAAGKNACTLHYTENSNVLQSGDLVLVDAGAEYQYYASDITRTYPINGVFTESQRAIYELVLSAQLAAIDKIRPGVLWETLQETIVKVLTTGLVKLGILKGNIENLIKQKAYLPFYMHGGGHWLGLDVHDVGTYKIEGKSRPLEPGMVLTVEPGIYISKNQTGVDKAWLGIGIRIEDDVLVTENGHEVLSTVPKTIEEIEKLMRTSQQSP